MSGEHTIGQDVIQFNSQAAYPAAAGELLLKDAALQLFGNNIPGRLFHLGRVSKSTDYTILDDDGYTIFFYNTITGARTLTLPTAGANPDRMIIVIKTDASANALTIDGEGAETINGDLTQTLTRQYQVMMLLCNGTEWFIIPLESDTSIAEIDDADSPYTITDNSPDTIFADTDGGAITINMPTLAANLTRKITVKNIGTSGNDVTADGEGAEKIDNELTQVISDLESAQMQGQSQEWSII